MPGSRPVRLPSLVSALFLRPLLAPPVAAMAAVGMLGEGAAKRLSDACFGAVQGALEATNRAWPQPVASRPVQGRAAEAPTVSPASAKAGSAEAKELRQISGIGVKLEKALKDFGVVSLVQLATWTDSDIARTDAELGLQGRILREDWVGQAKTLLKDKTDLGSATAR